MKKFLALMIVLTMLFALAIPVLAAGDGPSVGPGGVDSWTGGETGTVVPTSPQTGFEWAGWAAAAAIAILCAGCCFARARKTR